MSNFALRIFCNNDLSMLGYFSLLQNAPFKAPFFVFAKF